MPEPADPDPILPTPTDLVVLIGPAGCGKTTVGNALAATLEVEFLDGDALHPAANVARMREGRPLDDAAREPWLLRLHDELLTRVLAREGVVIACSALKRRYRDRLSTGIDGVRFVQLEADAETLHRRLAARRDHFFPAALLDSQLAAFEPLPKHARVDATLPPGRIVEEVLTVLARSYGARIVDGAALPVYDLGADHPFARDRQLPLFDLLRCTGLVDDDDLLATVPATVAELMTIHDLDYIECLIATSMPRPDDEVIRRAAHFGLGIGDNPITPGQHDAAAAVAGATLAAVDAVLDRTCRAAFNPAGGLHHAMPHRAAGFCLYNDVALALHRARDRGLPRVLYVDFDVHHGDGVEFAFRDDPSVLTLSFHEDPRVRYPGTGFVEDVGEGEGRGYALNVTLHPGTGDASFLQTIDRVVTAAFRGFAPDLVVSQHGCDIHRDDPLASLECTTRSAQGAAALVRQLADRHCGGRWIATGGGGYRPHTVIPRAFGMVWAELSGRRLPAVLPSAWSERWAERAAAPMPTGWFDSERITPRQATATAANMHTVRRLFELVPWLEAASR